MRLLVFGHISDTGFGIVTHELCSRFLERGVDVRVIAVNHRGEPIRGPLSGRVWPSAIAGQGYGGNISSPAITGDLWPALDAEDEWQPDAVLAISDMSGLYGHMGSRDASVPPAWQSVPVYHYCPIEGDNLSPAWQVPWQHVQPIAMSEYGQRVISAYLGRSVPMIYHGVDWLTFRPVAPNEPITLPAGASITSKRAAKEAFGLDPDRKLIFRSDRLVTRKFYDRFITLIGMVLEADPLVDVLMHCVPNESDWNLFEEIGRLPQSLWPRIKFSGRQDTFKGLTRDQLAVLMNAADLYVTTTGGEGFGLNLAESLACEVPVVSTGWAAEVEVVGPGGITVPPLMDSYGEPVRYHSSFQMDWAVPDPKAFLEPVLTLLNKPARRRELGIAGRRHVIRNFSWDAAASEFLSLFEESHAAAA